MPPIQAEVLGQLLLIQSTLAELPTGEAVLRFVCRGLEDVPGVNAVGFALCEGMEPGTDDLPEGRIRFEISHRDYLHARLSLEVSAPELFALYEPYLRNLCFMLGVVLEERRLRAQSDASVEEKTRELRVQVEAASRARDDALEQRDRAQRYLEVAEALILELDTQGRILVANPLAWRLLGKSESELVGQDWFELAIAPEVRDQVRQVFLATMAGKSEPGVRYHENEILGVGGRRHRIAWHNELRVGPGGEILGTLSSGTDVTERQLAAQERKALEQRLERARKMEGLGLLAGGVAHDLNNVLSGILAYPDVMLQELPPDSELRESLEVIRESAQRSAAIVQDLLTVARGVASIHKPLDLNRISREYLDSSEVRKLLEFHPRVELNLTLDEELLPLRGSDVHLRKSLMNLVHNAVEAIHGVGKVLISTHNRVVEAPAAGPVPAGEYVVLEVSDDGPGVAPSDLERIFEPFFTRKQMGRSGSGLGLTVVWNTVQDHCGFVNLTSRPGQTRFELYFPTSREPLEEAAGAVELALVRGRGEAVLVVDDEKLQRDVAARLLSHLGYQVTCVESGERAVERVGQQAFALVMIDMLMPGGLGGRETFERIVETRPGQRALLASGFSDGEEVRRAQALGAGRLLRKPYTLAALAAAVRQALAQD